ncbi:MAG: iron-sulfur cluster assembly scaffold protein [Desulfobacteraceae bacterium]
MGSLDDFLDNLQQEIFDEAKEAFGENGFDRWRNPRFQGRMEKPDGCSRVKGQCGDTMEIYLKFENGRVHDASYFTDGCASSGISGSFAAELAIGKDPESLTEITGDVVLQHIGRLPEDDRHCADLAAGAVQAALDDYMKQQAKM